MIVTLNQMTDLSNQLTVSQKYTLVTAMENDPRLFLNLISVFESLDPDSLELLKALTEEEIELRNKK